MIPKLNRLKERDVKRALQRWRPFFAYNVVTNLSKNKLGYPRFAIVIWKKSVKSGVERNFFRRMFFDKVKPYLNNENLSSDIVFVIKKTIKLSTKNEDSIKAFNKDVDFIIKKIIK